MTHTEKVKKTMQGFSCNKASAINIVYMLDWIEENESNLISLHKQFNADTGSDMDFNEFCYGMWPRCKVGYISKRRKPEYKDSAIRAQY